ncbi:Formate dehydrogenase-N subunit alpha [Beijerinckiaceae bacterium RH AL1]|nr:Formate dehydrogenase-N subunit alpha [Beijerinckiaceae bacterium RH CH11]VVB49261.1 Formate dehydrogenase-N subunit alpha [Beijerinckiaceae bacterium RH AL8]VVC56770.1 Formate dehydrogenase-N subunit alpha [Beijerinckiaceae bacterium RH AL1]
MTNTWMDIKNSDLIVIMGGNAAEAHPCGFKWVIEAKAHRGAKLVVIDPRFTRSASVADFYCPIRQGTDVAFLSGVIKYLLDNDKIQHEYVKHFTNASMLVSEGYSYSDGLFSGYDEEKRDYDKKTWDYQIGEDGFAKVDETLQDPRCVINVLKEHVKAYTPEMVSRITGSPQDKFVKICEMIAATSAPDKAMTSLYALGWTQHSYGAQNIRTMCLVQLLLGNIGVRGGGMNALRGHSNIQGLTDLGLLSNTMPGYMSLPLEKEATFELYMKSKQFKPTRPNQVSYWQNYPKFYASLQKAMFGDKATPENNFAFDWLPKLDTSYDVLKAFELMSQGKMTGYICQGFNPLMSIPDKNKVRSSLSKLKFLITMDPLETETARFWENHGEFNEIDPAQVQTEVIQLPTTCFAEDEGSLANSSRWLQWHVPAQDPPWETKSDIDILAGVFTRMRRLYEKEGGAFPDPILNTYWPYMDQESPTPDEVARELNGYALAPVKDPVDPNKVIAPGKQLDNFGQLQADGSTLSGCWIYTGCYTEQGNIMARRDTSDPSAAGIAPKWAFAWPANRRILYNRASADVNGKPWDEERKLVEWNGKKWTGFDVPDFVATSAPEKGAGPFILTEEGQGRLWCRALMRDGPFPAYYEPFESPIKNVLAPKIRGNPASRVFADDWKRFGDPNEFPYAATTYRLTEHFHYWTKHAKINAILQPEFFVEISEQLAAEKGVAKGDWVRVWSKRGSVKAKAVVTKRIKPLLCDGKQVHVVGVPIHWGFIGSTVEGYGANTLTPFVGDANTNTPEFKAFLVNIEKTTAPALVVS